MTAAAATDPNTSIECFRLGLSPEQEEGLGRLHHFGRYWMWGEVQQQDQPPLRLLEQTPDGIVALPPGERLLHRVPPGTPYFIDGLFGYWLIADADHQWFQLPVGDRCHYVLLAGGQSSRNRQLQIAWFCQECGAELGQPRTLRANGAPDAFLDAQAVIVEEFNRDRSARTCSRCGAVHPPAYGFRSAAPEPTVISPAPQPIARGNFGKPIIHATELPESSPVLVEVDGQAIALVRRDGEVCAVANVCPHKAGPFSDGWVSRNEIICPWHRFRFDLRSGCSVTNPALRVPTYRVQLEGDDVVVLGRRKPVAGE